MPWPPRPEPSWRPRGPDSRPPPPKGGLFCHTPMVAVARPLGRSGPWSWPSPATPSTRPPRTSARQPGGAARSWTRPPWTCWAGPRGAAATPRAGSRPSPRWTSVGDAWPSTDGGHGPHRRRPVWTAGRRSPLLRRAGHGGTSEREITRCLTDLYKQYPRDADRTAPVGQDDIVPWDLPAASSTWKRLQREFARSRGFRRPSMVPLSTRSATCDVDTPSQRPVRGRERAMALAGHQPVARSRLCCGFSRSRRARPVEHGHRRCDLLGLLPGDRGPPQALDETASTAATSWVASWTGRPARQSQFAGSRCRRGLGVAARRLPAQPYHGTSASATIGPTMSASRAIDAGAAV